MLHHIVIMPDIICLYGINRVNFFDEVHFVTRLMEKMDSYSAVIVIRETELKESFTFTLLLCPNENPSLTISVREEF